MKEKESNLSKKIVAMIIQNGLKSRKLHESKEN
jgi:hypothetical protein